MLFDPIQDPLDDPDFDGPDLENSLPDDFAALGEQLQADAQRLSSVYPACKAPTKLMEALAAEPQSWWLRRRVQITASAAAVVLLCGGITLLVASRAEPIARPAAPAVPVAPENSIASVDQVTPVNEELMPVSFRPALVDVNGPELEGLLDLWQEQSPAAGRIAF